MEVEKNIFRMADVELRLPDRRLGETGPSEEPDADFARSAITVVFRIAIICILEFTSKVEVSGYWWPQLISFLS